MVKYFATWDMDACHTSFDLLAKLLRNNMVSMVRYLATWDLDTCHTRFEAKHGTTFPRVPAPAVCYKTWKGGVYSFCEETLFNGETPNAYNLQHNALIKANMYLKFATKNTKAAMFNRRPSRRFCAVQFRFSLFLLSSALKISCILSDNLSMF